MASPSVLDAVHAVEWTAWTVRVRVVAADPGALPVAEEAVRAHLDAIDRAASRYREDSEVVAIARSAVAEHQVSPLLAALIAAALETARSTGGLVDPTVGGVLDARASTSPRPVSVRLRPTYADVRLEGTHLALPPGLLLDLGASAKAWAADRCALDAAQVAGCPVLVSLGGDLRVAGADHEWNLVVQDGPDQPASAVRLLGLRALATSSTLHRRWAGTTLQHILDPRTSRPAEAYWRTVSVAGPDCQTANALSTAAVVLGRGALPFLDGRGLPARLVGADGTIFYRNGWPR